MIVGVTGSLGTGKTTVARMLAAKGARVIDADKMAHRALAKGTDTYKKIVSSFGRSVLGRRGVVDRKGLAGIAFKDRRRLKQLIDIVHPFVIKEIKAIVRRAGRKDVLAIDAPLLIEARLTDIVDKIIVVKTDRRTQLSRCLRKRGFKKEDAMARIRSQMPLSKKAGMADYVIDNSGALRETKKQIDKIWSQMRP